MGEKKPAKERISEILFDADPENLRAHGCPKDEYDGEAETILFCCDFLGATATGSAIEGVFIEKFSTEHGDKHNMEHPEKFWADLVEKINEVLKERRK